MRRLAVLLGILLVATAVAGCHGPGPTVPEPTPTDGTTPPPTGDPAAPILFTESFEEGLEGWTKDSDLPDDPNRAEGKVRWNITATDERALEGDQSVNFTIDGRQGDGTIWISHPVPVQRDVRYRVNVSASAWSASESGNTIAQLVLYLGVDAPTGEGSFPPSGASGPVGAGSAGLREPLDRAEGWEAYAFEWETTPGQETLFVAVGITVVWETEMTYFVDDLRVTLDPVAE